MFKFKTSKPMCFSFCNEMVNFGPDLELVRYALLGYEMLNYKIAKFNSIFWKEKWFYLCCKKEKG